MTITNVGLGGAAGDSAVIAAAQADNAGNINHGFGISGVVDTTTGQITWSLGGAYSSLPANEYIVVATVMEATTARTNKLISQGAGSFVTSAYNSTSGAALDSVLNVVVVKTSS